MWSRVCIDARLLWPVAAALALGACSGGPRPAPEAPPTPVEAVDASEPGAEGQPAEAPIELPARAVADFERAVALMRAGQDIEAELEFGQIAAAWPDFAGPHINLGLLHRKAGRLDEAEQAFRAAIERNARSATAWSELGVTLRMLGRFEEAAQAYEQAIAVDPDHAPAYRNLGVLADLYLDQPERALAAFERYQALTGEDQPVGNWIAELRRRTGIPAPLAPAAQPAVAEGTPEAEPDTASAQSPGGSS